MGTSHCIWYLLLLQLVDGGLSCQQCVSFTLKEQEILYPIDKLVLPCLHVVVIICSGFFFQVNHVVSDRVLRAKTTRRDTSQSTIYCSSTTLFENQNLL